MSQLAATGRALAVREVVLTSVLVTVVATLASTYGGANYVASLVGAVFLAATWFRVWRHDDGTVRRFGLDLGGVVLPGDGGARHLLQASATATIVALATAAIVFVPFVLGWKLVWAPHRSFAFPWTMSAFANDVAGQVFVIALPEEAFYRGYVQTRLDDAWSPSRKLGGAAVGFSIPVASAIFAVGHIATVHHPARLAVFFPALLFGWLRARTGGIGASVLFHALCNVLAETLGRGYGVY